MNTGPNMEVSFWAVYDPNVWSGRAGQEVSSIWLMRSCVNVSGF
jgi:hypothetical protein